MTPLRQRLIHDLQLRNWWCARGGGWSEGGQAERERQQAAGPFTAAARWQQGGGQEKRAGKLLHEPSRRMYNAGGKESRPQDRKP